MSVNVLVWAVQRAGSVSNYDGSAEGTEAAWRSVSRSYGAYRGKARHRRVADANEFFDGVKEAERDCT